MIFTLGDGRQGGKFPSFNLKYAYMKDKILEGCNFFKALITFA